MVLSIWDAEHPPLGQSIPAGAEPCSPFMRPRISLRPRPWLVVAHDVPVPMSILGAVAPAPPSTSQCLFTLHVPPRRFTPALPGLVSENRYF